MASQDTADTCFLCPFFGCEVFVDSFSAFLRHLGQWHPNDYSCPICCGLVSNGFNLNGECCFCLSSVLSEAEQRRHLDFSHPSKPPGTYPHFSSFNSLWVHFFVWHGVITTAKATILALVCIKRWEEPAGPAGQLSLNTDFQWPLPLLSRPVEVCTSKPLSHAQNQSSQEHKQGVRERCVQLYRKTFLSREAYLSADLSSGDSSVCPLCAPDYDNRYKFQALCDHICKSHNVADGAQFMTFLKSRRHYEQGYEKDYEDIGVDGDAVPRLQSPGHEPEKQMPYTTSSNIYGLAYNNTIHDGDLTGDGSVFAGEKGSSHPLTVQMPHDTSSDSYGLAWQGSGGKQKTFYQPFTRFDQLPTGFNEWFIGDLRRAHKARHDRDIGGNIAPPAAKRAHLSYEPEAQRQAPPPNKCSSLQDSGGEQTISADTLWEIEHGMRYNRDIGKDDSALSRAKRPRHAPTLRFRTVNENYLAAQGGRNQRMVDESLAAIPGTAGENPPMTDPILRKMDDPVWFEELLFREGTT